MKTIVLLFVSTLFYLSSYCQDLSSLDRRLSVAVIGFDLNESAAKDALATGANINAVNGAMGGETFLISAIKGFKDPKVIKFLLDNGANPNLKDQKGRTALSYAQQYHFDRTKDGRDILKLLTTAMKIGPAQPEAINDKAADVPEDQPIKNQNTQPVKTKIRASKTGPPSSAEVKQTIEQNFTGIYQNHFYGVKNTVTFNWSGGVTVGGIQTVRSAPNPCYPVKLNVKVTITDPRDGNTSVVDRGQDANIGGYKKNEVFCFYRDGFGEWAFGVYER